jgi:hypothetical protein
MTDTPDNMRIWRQVEKTDPNHTKKVNQRGGFTAISAAYQIQRATEVFGPIGEGWGYNAHDPIFQDGVVFVPVVLWHGDYKNQFGPMFGGAEWRGPNGRLDSDALKKATTDALTKLLSQLGFNADVFLGRFDDNKYVADLREEFAEAVETITQDQADKLREELEATGSNVSGFLSFFKIDKIEALPATRHGEAARMIEAKRRAALDGNPFEKDAA